ncbi:Ubiquitin thioesterase OTU1 [Fusarium oxysporum f. sp. albedinis]|nr:Ubiquitin thioesterase OTU1 [Fusarium oxysporum f. sp. albedinis]
MNQSRRVIHQLDKSTSFVQVRDKAIWRSRKTSVGNASANKLQSSAWPRAYLVSKSGSLAIKRCEHLKVTGRDTR